jgi:hypothetical protein
MEKGGRLREREESRMIGEGERDRRWEREDGKMKGDGKRGS